MAARLEQARERLREALGRRGYAFESTAIATVLSAATAQAVPLPLVCNTVRAAMWFFSEQSASAGSVSTAAVALARDACRTMFLNKAKITVAILLFTALLGVGATMLLKAEPPRSPAQASPRPTLDAPEQPLPRGAVARMGTTRLRQGDAVHFAAFMPGDKSLVTAGRDGTVRLWGLASGKEIRRFAWDGVQPDPGAEQAQDILEKQQQQLLDDLALGRQVALSGDGKVVAASRAGVVCLWDSASGKKLHDLQTGQKRLVHLAFSPDSKTLVTVGPNGQAVAFWEVATGKCLRRSQTRLPAGYDINVFVQLNDEHAIVSPGLKYLAYQWREPSGKRQLHVRELATGKELPPIRVGEYGGPLAFCFSADDRTLMWVDWYFAGGVVFSDVATGKELRRLGDRRHKNGTYADRPEIALAIAVSVDGKSLAVCRQSHTIELWDVGTGKLTYPVGMPTLAQLYHSFPDYVGANVRPALVFSCDGKTLLSSLGSSALRQFHVETGRELPGLGNAHQAPVEALALSTDGKSLRTFSGGDPLRVWDWTTGKETKQEGIPATAAPAAFAGEDQIAFAVGNEVTVRSKRGTKTWRVAGGEFPPLMALALSPDGAFLATRSYDNPEIKLWDARGKHRCTLGRAGSGPTFTADGLREAAGVVTPDLLFSPDGRCLAGAGPRWQLCLWDVDRGDLLWELRPEAGQVVERFAFSPGGHFLATLQTDGSVTLYEVASGARRASFAGTTRKNWRVYLAYDNAGRVRLSFSTRRAGPICLAISPDGRYLATAHETPTIHLWDVLNGRELGQFKGHEGGVVSLLFSADGKHLFSGGTDTTALTWDVARLTQRPTSRAVRLQPGDLDTLWGQLASSGAAQAFAAMRRLCASPDQAVSLIEQRVRPATAPEPKRLARLIAHLEGSRLEREQAQAQLREFAELAEPALRKALSEEPSLNLRQRLERLLSVLGKAPPAAKRRELRAIEVLEWIGSAAARQVLQELAEGPPGSRLTRAASTARQRLDKRTARR
jgi:WD40 repeat protein